MNIIQFIEDPNLINDQSLSPAQKQRRDQHLSKLNPIEGQSRRNASQEPRT